MTAFYDAIEAATHDITFDVEKRPMFLANGFKVPDKVALVNLRTEQPVSVVSNRYALITNREVVQKTADSIIRAGIDITDFGVSTQASHHGSRTLLRFDFPAYQVLKETKNATHLSIVVMNSYDGSWRYQTNLGAIRMACANGCVFGDMLASAKYSHRHGISVADISDRLVGMIDDFGNSEEWFTTLMGRKVTDDEVDLTFLKFLDLTDEDALDSSRVVKELHVLFDKYAIEMGKNAYALYNSLTDFVTHRKRRKDTAASALVYEEERLGKTLSLPVFN
jgi:hypothetical protein